MVLTSGKFLSFCLVQKILVKPFFNPSRSIPLLSSLFCPSQTEISELYHTFISVYFNYPFTCLPAFPSLQFQSSTLLFIHSYDKYLSNTSYHARYTMVKKKDAVHVSTELSI